MDKKVFLLELVKDVVKPAFGCTEIGIVALACAKAATLLKSELKSALVTVSPYIYRNDARVGVPNLGRCGIETIAASGFVLKNPEEKLTLLSELTLNNNIKKTHELANKKIIKIKIDYDVDPVYTRVEAIDISNNKVDVIIKTTHDNIVSAKFNDKETLSSSEIKSDSSKINFSKYIDLVSIEDACEIVKSYNMEDLDFLLEGIDMNKQLCEQGLKNSYDHSMSLTIQRLIKKELDPNIKFNSETLPRIFSIVLGYVSSSVDARMYGCPLPVMSSNNSGDHGLTITVPLTIYARAHEIKTVKLLQSLVLAHFVTWLIKNRIGHLSALCGSAIAAACGTMTGIAFQRNFSWQRINDVINMLLCASAGTICDGAKPSCSFKIMSAITTGFLALELVSAGGRIEDGDGVVCKYAEDTIKNIGKISRDSKDIVNKSMVEVLENWNK